MFQKQKPDTVFVNVQCVEAKAMPADLDQGQVPRGRGICVHYPIGFLRFLHVVVRGISQLPRNVR